MDKGGQGAAMLNNIGMSWIEATFLNLKVPQQTRYMNPY